jgi:hypothetical protein
MHSMAISTGTADDWFESASEVNSSRQVSPWTNENNNLHDNDLSTLEQHCFQPISDQGNDSTNQYLPAYEHNIVNRSRTPRMSETGIFSRSPATRQRRRSSSRSIPSPVSKANESFFQMDTRATMSKRSSTTATPVSNERRMSGRSVRENSLEDANRK